MVQTAPASSREQSTGATAAEAMNQRTVKAAVHLNPSVLTLTSADEMSVILLLSASMNRVAFGVAVLQATLAMVSTVRVVSELDFVM